MYEIAKIAGWVLSPLVMALLIGAFLRCLQLWHRKPMQLSFLAAHWSRRITQEHRCVYLVKVDRVEFLQGRYHYG